MKRQIKYILIIILLFGIGLSSIQTVSAQSIADLRKELEELESERSGIDEEESDAEAQIAENERRQQAVENKINEIDGELEVTEASIDEKQQEINTTNAEISNLEASISETETQISETESELEALEGELEVLNEEIEELIERIEERDILIKNRLRSMQHNGGNINYLQVLFGAQSFGDFINRVTAVSKIFDSDRTIMTAQEQDKADLEDKRVTVEDKKMTVEDKKAQLVADKEALDDQKSEVESKRATLVAQQNELSTLQAQLNEQRTTQVAAAEELEEEHANLEEHKLSIAEQRQIIADQQSMIADSIDDLKEQERLAQLAAEKKSSEDSGNGSQNNSGNGGLIWPSRGSTSSEYGWRIHPIYGDRRFHAGIDIRRDAGLDIVAAADGVVTGVYYSGPTRGYGRYIVVHHAGINMTTLYAHLASTNVSRGQTVSQGQKIGVMGTTGGSTGIHLHFEVYEGVYDSANRVNPRTHLP